MSTYNDLQQSNINDDLEQRRKYLSTLSDKELVAAINPVNDVRNITVINQLLRQRGVIGVPK